MLSLVAAPEDDDERARLARIRAQLLEARAARPQPALDDKALASWNGMALAALRRGRAPLPAARTCWRPPSAARPSCSARCRIPTAASGARTAPGAARCPAFLDDYAQVAVGLLRALPGDARAPLPGRVAPARAARVRALRRARRLVLRHRARRRGARRAPARARRQPDAVGQLDARRAARAARAHLRRARARAPRAGRRRRRSGRCWRARRRASVTCSASATRCSRRRARRPWSARADDPATAELDRRAARLPTSPISPSRSATGATTWASRCSRGAVSWRAAPAVYVCSGFVCAAPATDAHMVRTALLNANPT